MRLPKGRTPNHAQLSVGAITPVLAPAPRQRGRRRGADDYVATAGRLTPWRAAAVALVASLAAMTCNRQSVGVGQGQPLGVSTCPDDDVLEALHDAAFFLEHRRDLPRVARDLEEIRRRVTAVSPGATMVLPLIERIGALAARGGVLEPETEQIRSELHASPCMTTAVHRRFHAALPPSR